MLNKSNEVEVKTSKDNKKRNIILIVVGLLLLIVILFLLWFFNRKFEVTFDYNNGSKEEVVLVKYNKTIDNKDVKAGDDLGEQFIDWYLVLEEKDGNDILSEKPFDFKTKINENTKLKAVYKGVVETIIITFDSKGGSKVEPITINKGAELTLPKDPTYKGYTFKGWVDKNDKSIDNKTTFEEDTTLYAKWEKVEEKKTEPKKETPKKETPKQEVKKEEKISLSLSNYYMHRDGTKTSRATAKVENASGNVTYSLSSTVCARINSSSGVITAIPYSELDSMGEQICEAGQTVTVIATLPSGKSASKTLTLEKDLILSAGNKAYISTTTDINTGSNDFVVKANQSVKWATSGTASGSVTTNNTTCKGKANASTSRFATIIATTVGGQKVEVHWYSVVN